MAVDTDQFVHLCRPLAPSNVGIQSNISPLTVHIHPQAIISVLDHASRRDNNDTQSTRVIGALVGTRSEDGSDVEVRSCFAIPHTENEDQVEVDVEYQKNMLSLTLRGSPRESLLGWYTTSSELNSFSALIQNYFANPDTGTFPHPAVHLTLSTAPGSEIEMRTYISAPVAVNPERESCLFIQVPHHLSFSDPERSALEAFDAAKNEESRMAPISSDIESLTRALEETIAMLERVSDWVNSVLDEDREPNNVIGQFLLNALSLAPKVDPSQIEHDFNNHIQDILMVSYLTNTIRTQIELSQRLAMSTLHLGEKEVEAGKVVEGDKSEQWSGMRGGKKTTRGGGAHRGGGQARDSRDNND